MREGARTINDVLDAVAAHFNITREEVVSGRTSPRARQLAKYLACRVTGCSLPLIGAAFGGVSSTNVAHALRKIERDMAVDAQFAAEVEGIEERLRAL